MRYKTNADLPETVQKILPEKAQNVYRDAYNKGADEYQDLKERATDNDSQEASAHKIAWEAVKKLYHKVGDMWEEITQ